MSSFALPRKPSLSVGLMLFMLCFLGGLAAPSIAIAGEVDEEFARELFAEGHALFDEGEYEAAIEKFLEVYEILDAPALLYNIGEAYRRADKLAEAEEYYQKYINAAPDAANADAVVERIIDIQQERVARKASLSLTSTPSQGQLFIDDDDEARCQTPCEIDLAPGEYTLKVELEGYLVWVQELELEPREDAELEARLEREIAMGQLIVTTDVEGAVLVAEGKRHSLPHDTPIEVEAKTQAISLVWEGDEIHHSVEVEADEDLHLFIPIGATGGDFSLLQGASIGLGGVSVALATAAIFTGMQARSTHDYLDRYQQTHGGVDPNVVIVGERQKRLTNNLWMGAIASLSTGVGLWTWDKMRSRGGDSGELEPTEIEDEADPQRGPSGSEDAEENDGDESVDQFELL